MSRHAQSVLEPLQHSGPYRFLLARIEHISTWFRLILSKGERSRPLTHRGSLCEVGLVSTSVATVVHLVGLHPCHEYLIF